MTPTLEQLKRTVAQRSKGVDRHYDKMDAIEEWDKKGEYQKSITFVGARDALISAQMAYIAALESALTPEPPAPGESHQWPKGEPVCTCEKHTGEGWFCDACGGGKF